MKRKPAASKKVIQELEQNEFNLPQIVSLFPRPILVDWLP